MRKFTVLLVLGAMCTAASAAPGMIPLNTFAGESYKPLPLTVPPTAASWGSWDPGVGAEMVVGGRYLAVWQGLNSPGPGANPPGPGVVEMNAQWFSHVGVPIGGNFQVNTTSWVPGVGNFPDRTGVAVDGSGNAIVTWTLNNTDLYYRSLAPGGGFNGPETLLTTTVNGPYPSNAAWTSVSMNAAGQGVITYQDTAAAGGPVYAQLISSTGVLTGGPITVNTTANVGLARSAIDSSGKFIVNYRDAGLSASAPGNVYVRAFDAVGNPTSAEIVVGTSTITQGSTSTISCNEAGDTVVVWEQSSPSPQTLYYQQLDTAGNLVGTTKVASTAAGGLNGSILWAAVDVAANGNIQMAWMNSGIDGGSWGYAGRRFNKDGGASELEWVMNAVTTERQQYGDMASTPEGDSMIVFSMDDRVINPPGRYMNNFGAMLTATEPAPSSLGAPEVPGAPRRGDVDRNDYTDFNDVLIMLNTANWQNAPAARGDGWAVGDVNNDNITDFNDILICLNSANWQQGTPPTGVPEPATMSLLALGALALVRRRRR